MTLYEGQRAVRGTISYGSNLRETKEQEESSNENNCQRNPAAPTRPTTIAVIGTTDAVVTSSHDE